MLEVQEPWDPCQGKLNAGSGTGPREGSVLWLVKLGGQSHVSQPLTLDTELQDLEFALLGGF